MENGIKNYIILIPAYKPVYDEMIPFVKELLQNYEMIVTVDDGGGEKYAEVFDECEKLGCKVIHHEVNKGKGAALRTGFTYIKENLGDCAGVITADCDGQHAVEDIIKVTNALIEHPDDLIIGGRRFDDNVPFRSQFGNSFTRFAFKLATGIKIYDTQTGLRGIPMHLMPEMISLNGDRYEYEMNMLLKLHDWGVKPYEITIKTIYLNENKGSHFNAFRDGLRIISRIIKYAAGGILSFAVDWIVFFVMNAVLSGLPDAQKYAFSFGIARAVSSTVNYLLNRFVVFGGKNYRRGTTAKYFALVIAVLLLGMLVQRVTYFVPGEFAHSAIKFVYDSVMFFVNYIIQRDFVFKIKERHNNTK